MTSYPGATWYDLGRDDLSTTPLVHDIICLHSMVGTLAGSLAWSSRDGGTYWHFGVGSEGQVRQCQNLDFKSAANLNGNWHVIPIETSDTNEGVWPSPWAGNVSWTQAQIDALIKLIAWLCVRYNIPPVLIPDTCSGRRGIGYHRQGIDGNYSDGRKEGCEKWSNATGKTCPQDPRIVQLKTLVIPGVQALVNGDEEDMYGWTEETFKTVLRNLTQQGVEQGLQASGSVTRTEVIELVKRGVDKAFATSGSATRSQVAGSGTVETGLVELALGNLSDATLADLKARLNALPPPS